MTTISADESIGDDAAAKVLVILPGELEGGWERLINVAGRAENTPNDGAVLS